MPLQHRRTKTKRKHKGTFEELKKAVYDYGLRGKWRLEIRGGPILVYVFKRWRGGRLNWFVSTGTLLAQAK
jgi:hypothetical protein